MKTFLRDLKTEFAGYNGAKFAKDLMAGLTVAAVALPLALAFGVSSGATAASGLITAIIGGAIIGALGGAFYQISGPTAAVAAIRTYFFTPQPLSSLLNSLLCVIIIPQDLPERIVKGELWYVCRFRGDRSQQLNTRHGKVFFFVPTP